MDPHLDPALQFTEMQRSVGLVASAALDKVHTGVETASSALRSATGGDGVVSNDYCCHT